MCYLEIFFPHVPGYSKIFLREKKPKNKSMSLSKTGFQNLVGTLPYDKSEFCCGNLEHIAKSLSKTLIKISKGRISRIELDSKLNCILYFFYST